MGNVINAGPSKGHPLTPALLNRVADLMIQGKMSTSRINSRKFYMFLFESLKRLAPRDQAVAKMLFARLAQLTSTDYPARSIREVIEDPEILRLTSEDERLTALTNLEKERAVEFDHSRAQVRIRVPLTAAAIREDAFSERQDAMRQLKSSGGPRS